MQYTIYSAYVESEGNHLYTLVMLPEENGTYPIVIQRSPYVDDCENMSEPELFNSMLIQNGDFLNHGYAVVMQHCRGRGKSDGDCIPYIHEREDGLALQEWLRKQPFYQGELYLCGGSYLTSVHYATAPFASDIKGAVLEVQDSERYNIVYRNGFFKTGLHGDWYVGMYKHKSIPYKNYVKDSYRMLPLSEFTKTVFGEPVHDFDETIRHVDKNDQYWATERIGGADAHNAVKHARIPVLLVTSFYDIYTGGIFDMWNALDDETRRISALAVTPYDHSRQPNSQPVTFPDGTLWEKFPSYSRRWLDMVRTGSEPPFTQGKVTYYRLFENDWRTDDFTNGPLKMELPLGDGSISYVYNPYAPASFKGGLSLCLGGTAYQDAPNSRYDIKSQTVKKFESDTFIRGKMCARLTVSSDCEDTCFYLRLSLVKPEGAYGLRDDIRKISDFAPDYKPGDDVVIDFEFDEHAFLAKAGESLRLDISSSCVDSFVPHTNNRGLFSEQTTARIAHNTVKLDRSELTIFCEQ